MIRIVVQDDKAEGKNAYNHSFTYYIFFCKELLYELTSMFLDDIVNHIYGHTSIFAGIYSNIEPIFHK